MGLGSFESSDGTEHVDITAEPNDSINEPADGGGALVSGKQPQQSNTNVTSTADSDAAVPASKKPSAKIYNANTGRFYTTSTADEVVDTDSDAEESEPKEGSSGGGADVADTGGTPNSKLSSFMTTVPSGSRLSPGALEKTKAEDDEAAASTAAGSPLPERSVGKVNSFTKFTMSTEEANMNGAPGMFKPIQPGPAAL